ncbi:MAG: SBBP repeat-containing protein [Candidatus Sabulitectum sp.]|nr:SBBP repeat-containing protein [Candidatus Sabulitectum sp.]
MTVSSSRINVLLALSILLAGSSLAQGDDPVEAWVSLFCGPGDASDLGWDIAVDQTGNVYVAGDSQSDSCGGGGYDIVTIKYDSSGVEQWVARFNGLVSAMALDEVGNAYVTGSSTGVDTGSDCITISYNSSGEIRWLARYDSPESGGDQGIDIAVDRAGNVFVAALADNSFTTIMYDSTGIEQWVVSLKNSGSPAAIALDAAGNVLVTGRTGQGISNFDMVTVKYSQTGEELWVSSYIGPAHDKDLAEAIDTDAQGNVYVAGRSMGRDTETDIVTIRYNCSTGDEEWVRRLDRNGNDGGDDLVVDEGAGIIYVTGYSGPVPDYTTIAYSLAGEQKWVAFYHYLERVADYANAVSLDESGNIYVTGGSAGADDGEYCGDYATIMYNPSGVQQWAARYSSPGNRDDQAKAIAVDGAGSVYITGYISDSGHDNIATIKYEQSMTEE